MIAFQLNNPFWEQFLQCQETGYDTALAELRAGRKENNWMRYIFPQLKGLKASVLSEQFGIPNLVQARAYLAHPVLGPRLRECCKALLQHEALSAEEIFGIFDDTKLRSSMTLFSLVSEEPLFRQVLNRFFDGKPDPCTIARATREKGMVIEDGVLLDCFGYQGHIEIPQGVRAIAPKAFYKNRDIESVTLPEGVTRIGASGFYCCTNLKTIHIPNSVEMLGVNAFFGCWGLQEIRLPAGLTGIPVKAFYGCCNLKKVLLPDSLVRIRDRAFAACDSLTCVQVSESVETADHWVDVQPGQSRRLRLPKSVARVDGFAFWGCENLQNPENRGLMIHQKTNIK